MRSFAIVLLSIGLLWGANASAEELSVPVDYRGQQIQLTGRFDKPTAQGPLAVVILLHNCAGADGSPSLAVWANAQANGMMQFQLYPEAYHAFDAASGIEKPHSAYGHLVAFDPAATADAHKRVPEFLYRYLH